VIALRTKAIATLNFKGGVGKTTIAWLLANYLAKEEGKRALLMDMDAHK
jgi:chromosome partitioning protein